MRKLPDEPISREWENAMDHQQRPAYLWLYGLVALIIVSVIVSIIVTHGH